MSATSRFWSATVFVLLSLRAFGAEAQTFTFAGGEVSRRVPSARDFAATEIGNPWDFEQSSDFSRQFSTDWVDHPSVAGGRFTGTVKPASPCGGTLPDCSFPALQLQFEGILGGLNWANRNGLTYPIDPALYNRLSFRMRRPKTTIDLLEVFWFQSFTRSPAFGAINGGRLINSSGFDGGYRRFTSQAPPASQTGADYQIYKIDLDTPPVAGRSQGRAWNAGGPVRGMTLTLGESMAAPGALAGATIDVDWVRLTPRNSATVDLQWQQLGGRVTLRATRGTDTVQIFPDDGTSAVDFPDNSTFKWDYGFLPAGTWTVTATSGQTTRSITLTIAAQPIINLTEPDARGGRDFARSVIGDAWDLTNPQDVTRWGQLGDIAGATFTDAGLSGTSSGLDPHVQLLNDIGRPPGTSPVIDASVYRHLSFVFEVPRKDLPAEQWFYAGAVSRVVWRKANSPQTPFTNSQDIFIVDSEPVLYTIDLATMIKPGCDTCADCHLEEPAPACSDNQGALLGTETWTGSIGALRFDPLEPEASQFRPFRLSDVRLTADDEPNGNGFFTIRWNALEASADLPETAGVADSTVKLYWDADTNPANGRTLIVQGIPATFGQYAWSVAGLNPGRYWILAEITDTAGNTQSRYSTGPMRIAARVAAPTDANADGMDDNWAARYGVTTAAADDDSDGVSNVDEYRNSTHPMLPQTWHLSEGATGFFNERIAVVNPDTAPATVTVTFLRESGAPIVRDYPLAGQSRLTIPVNDVAGLASAAVSAVVTASNGGVIVERTMLWDARGGGLYGGHLGKGIPAARTTWFLAEGEQNFFDTYILFANAGATHATVTVNYLLDGGNPVQRTYDVAANARLTVYAGLIPELKGRAFSTTITSSAPITVERAMYFGSVAGRLWNGGHEAAAVPAPSTNWFVAEGRSGPVFDTYLLIANPNPSATVATIRFLVPGGGAISKTYDLPAQSRRTVHVDSQDARLADTDVSAEISAPLPVVVERAMYWPDPSTNWQEAHSSAGVTTTGTLWAMAEGEVGGPMGWTTFILLANPSPSPTLATVTFLRTDRPPLVITQMVPANSRVTIDAQAARNAQQQGLDSGERFGVMVDTGASGVPIVVEHAIYFNGPQGQFWAGGMNETAVRIR